MVTNTSHDIWIRPSDAASWVSCVRRTWLDMHQPRDSEADAFGQLLFDAGLQHENTVLTMLKDQYQVHHATSFEHTEALMQQGAMLIYQARLRNAAEKLVGYPDFLIRLDNGQYQAADAKLTQSENKKALQIQLGLYRRLLANEQPVIAFLGDASTAVLGEEIDALVDEFMISMRQLREQTEQPVVHYSHSRCRICPYFTHCHADFKRQQELSLLPGIHGRTAAHLVEKTGIQTISQLAQQNVGNIPDVPHLTGLKRKHRAILQARAFLRGEAFQLSPVTLPEGVWVHFDIEDNPLTSTRQRHVYLWGLLAPPYRREDFDYVWTDDETEDYQGWLAFLDKVAEYRTRYSALIFAHYSNHEKATIRKYAEHYQMTDDGTVQWLLGQTDQSSPLFDMQKVVLDNLVLPLQGYGLKDICKHPELVNFQWENEESGSQWSVVQFNRFLIENNPLEKQRLKTEILGYNRDDVTATRKLEEWLRSRFMQSVDTPCVPPLE